MAREVTETPQNHPLSSWPVNHQYGISAGLSNDTAETLSGPKEQLAETSTVGDDSPDKHTPSSVSVKTAGLVSDASDALENFSISDATLRQRPLHFMDLPVDVLEEIIKQVGGSNDLISLAVCNSWLHAIVMPHMYSRFDIVWPEPGEEAESRPGVDALAYGLGTLVMSGIIYGPQHTAYQKCRSCGYTDPTGEDLQVQLVSNYAQFVRKFAIGNGPHHSVSSYHYSTESGKMLGTLVAMAVARMTSLEIFFWDMPTGIVREVWTALSSLGRRRTGKEKPSNLASIWIRCHDSDKVRSPSQIISTTRPPQTIGANSTFLQPSYERIEHPNFSILPPLRKIGVVGIDELAYFEELAILIGKSHSCLKELRVGALLTSPLANFENARPGFLTEPKNTCLGAGGVLGLLLSRIHDCRQHQPASPRTLKRQIAVSDLSSVSLAAAERRAERAKAETNNVTTTVSEAAEAQGATFNDIPTLQETHDDITALTLGQDAGDMKPDTESTSAKETAIAAEPASDTVDKTAVPEPTVRTQPTAEAKVEPLPDQKTLQLKVLELENIIVPFFVLKSALDWSLLTDLTLLNCALDEELWVDVKTTFAPIPKFDVGKDTKPTSSTHFFPLKLRKIHVDGVSASFISVLKECLAPDTLECLFLQDRKNFSSGSKVTVDAICRGPLRRHRGSLQKLSIDSQFKHEKDRNSYCKWLLTKDVLSFVFGGKIPKLRELAVSIKYDDWHYVLQNLPNLPRLRSLYIPFILNYPSPSFFNAREIALQVQDIVTLRPEMELCYVAIQNKCFEILEGKKADSEELVSEAANGTASGSSHTNWADPLGEDSLSDDSEEEEEDDDVFVPAPATTDPAEEHGEDNETGAYSDTESEGSDVKAAFARRPKLRLREILFYTEKVDIFKIDKGTIMFSA